MTHVARHASVRPSLSMCRSLCCCCCLRHTTGA